MFDKDKMISNGCKLCTLLSLLYFFVDDRIIVVYDICEIDKAVIFF